MIRAVVLLSGGLDSATVLALASREGREIFALTFDYGQRHHVELDRARELARKSRVFEHRVFHFDLRQFGGSALTADLPVPKDALNKDGIPITYVPGRNTIFLSLALGYAEAIDAREIWTGINNVDFSGYPDCRPAFLEAFQNVIRVGTRSGVERGYPLVVAPLINLSKPEVIRMGLEMKVDYSLTHSCYDPDAFGMACGRCDACLIRRKGFQDAGLPDPTLYSAKT